MNDEDAILAEIRRITYDDSVPMDVLLTRVVDAAMKFRRQQWALLRKHNNVFTHLAKNGMTNIGIHSIHDVPANEWVYVDGMIVLPCGISYPVPNHAVSRMVQKDDDRMDVQVIKGLLHIRHGKHHMIFTNPSQLHRHIPVIEGHAIVEDWIASFSV